MNAAGKPLSASFWLLDAPDSLSAQSHRNPDGTGLGTYDARGRPVVDKAPIAAFEDIAFAREARHVRSRTFVAHVRFASTGAHTLANTHPFEQDGRLFAHNGVVGDLPRLDEHLGTDRELVGGETDSERLFALITRETRARDGDLPAGIVAAIEWVADHLALYSVNFVLTTATELFALRYPDTHDLYVLARGAEGGRGPLEHSSSLGTRVRSAEAAGRPVVVVATERMDDDPAWQEMASGELLRVGPDADVTRRIAIDRAPAHLLSLADLDEHGRSSQAPSG